MQCETGNRTEPRNFGFRDRDGRFFHVTRKLSLVGPEKQLILTLSRGETTPPSHPHGLASIPAFAPASFPTPSSSPSAPSSHAFHPVSCSSRIERRQPS